MRKLFIIMLLFAAACSQQETPSNEVRAYISAGVDFGQAPDWVIPVQNVPGFTHIYDSTTLLTTNNTTNAQTTTKGSSNSFSIVLTEGSYNMYMSTKDPKAVEKYLHFTASTQTANIVKGGAPIVLPADTKQALLMVAKAAVTSAPTMVIAGKTYTMYLNAGNTFYYAYINAPAPVTVRLNMSIGSRDLVLTKNNKYLVANQSGATITTDELILNTVTI